MYDISCITGSTGRRRGWWWLRESNLETREGSKRGRSRQKVDKVKEEEEDLIKKRVERIKRKRRQCGGN